MRVNVYYIHIVFCSLAVHRCRCHCSRGGAAPSIHFVGKLSMAWNDPSFSFQRGSTIRAHSHMYIVYVYVLAHIAAGISFQDTPPYSCHAIETYHCVVNLFSTSFNISVSLSSLPHPIVPHIFAFHICFRSTYFLYEYTYPNHTYRIQKPGNMRRAKKRNCNRVTEKNGSEKIHYRIVRNSWCYITSMQKTLCGKIREEKCN